MKVPIKGGYVEWSPRVIIFTSNFEPSSWWIDHHRDMPRGWKDQFDRRVTEVREFTTPYEPPAYEDNSEGDISASSISELE